MFMRLSQKLASIGSDRTTEFYTYISELLEHEQVMELDHFTQHYSYTRLSHSLDVAYYSFCIAKTLGWDSESTARGGLLHDLFLYDWRDDSYVRTGRNHAMEHPKVALENARKICKLNKIEENIIRRHMWLITLTPPRYKEAYIVTFVDKYCALREFCVSLFNRGDKPRAVFAND